jgi:hypothetical protein
MANVNAPSGFNPVREANGGTIRPATYQIASALAALIYRGSLVKPVNTTKRIDVAAASDRIIGAFHGVAYVEASGDTRFRPYWPTGQTLLSGTTADATVYDNPDILFAAQVSGAAGAIATDIGNFANFVVGTGSTITGTSGDMIDQTTLGTTQNATAVVRLEELQQIVGNDYGQYAKVLCRINNHYLSGNLTAI